MPEEPHEKSNVVPLSTSQATDTQNVDPEIIPLQGSREGPSDISEDAMALRFISKHEDVLRYVGQWQRWMTYTGALWEVDHKMLVYEKARLVVRDIAKRLYMGEMHRSMDSIASTMLNAPDADKKARTREAKKRAMALVRPIKSSRTIYNVVALGRHDHRVSSHVDVWDSHPWLLNTPDGTVDLQGGHIRAHSSKDYLTMSTAVGPGAEKPARWIEFMKEITDGDEELASYLQRILGYCLTGTTGEQAMFFGFGAGANGKSVILNVIGGILGAYHRTAPMETFVQTSEYRHPTELANLRGARLVTATETQGGRKWDEVKIKRLTGGDMISARFMRQDFFEYMPQFKLFVAGNHKPAITNVDEAMRRRFNLIPFTVTIPKERRDPILVNKLMLEGPGILSWLIDGCQEWQAKGLHTPAMVTEATTQYMSLEDGFTAWWTECCEPNPRAFTTVGDLFDVWAKWAEKNGDVVGSKKAFSQTMLGKQEILKIKYFHLSEGRGFRGVSIKLKPSSNTENGPGK